MIMKIDDIGNKVEKCWSYFLGRWQEMGPSVNVGGLKPIGDMKSWCIKTKAEEDIGEYIFWCLFFLREIASKVFSWEEAWE